MDNPLTSLVRRAKSYYLNDLGYGSGQLFATALARSADPGDLFLDVGCGEGYLRRIVPDGVRYVGIDRYAGDQSNEYDSWTMRPDVIADAHHLPFRSGIFQAVALMHVLEHVIRPDDVLGEIFRVLKPGGQFFMDVPFLHEVHHAPHDHFRFTRYGLAELASRQGFEIVEIRPSGGYFRCLAHMLKEAPAVISGPWWSAGLLKLLIAWPLRWLGWMIGKIQYPLDIHDHRQLFTAGYHCIFRKPV